MPVRAPPPPPPRPRPPRRRRRFGAPVGDPDTPSTDAGVSGDAGSAVVVARALGVEPVLGVTSVLGWCLFVVALRGRARRTCGPGTRSRSGSIAARRAGRFPIDGRRAVLGLGAAARRLPCRSRSCCVRGPLGCGGALGRRFRSRFPRRPMTALRLLRRLRKIRWFVVRRPNDAGRRWWSRCCLPRPDCPGSYGELPSLIARERDVGERADRTGGVGPACGTVAGSVERTRPPAACAAAIRAARVIAHPIRPSGARVPALAALRGSGARRAAVRAPPRLVLRSRSCAAWGAALGEQVWVQHSSGVARDREAAPRRCRASPGSYVRCPPSGGGWETHVCLMRLVSHYVTL